MARRRLERINKVFLGCNYSNQKVKNHFNNLKISWEENWPIEAVLIDKEREKGAEDIWDKIATEIEESSLLFFDVSAFRPNVVLELGYALARKSYDQIVISFCDRKESKKRRGPAWMLSDISHLKRINYRTITQLNEKLEENLQKLPTVERFIGLEKDIKSQTAAWSKYVECTRQALKRMRDGKPRSDEQIKRIIQGCTVTVFA